MRRIPNWRPAEAYAEQSFALPAPRLPRTAAASAPSTDESHLETLWPAWPAGCRPATLSIRLAPSGMEEGAVRRRCWRVAIESPCASPTTWASTALPSPQFQQEFLDTPSKTLPGLRFRL